VAPPPAALPVGTLFVVATPIGNLEDITLRALRVLRAADLVAAEDTRRTRALLQAYGVHVPLVSYFAHNQARRGPEIVRRLQGGARVALVTDAGTPGVSDPGFQLVRLAGGGFRWCRSGARPWWRRSRRRVSPPTGSSSRVPARRPGRRLTRLTRSASPGVRLHDEPAPAARHAEPSETCSRLEAESCSPAR
jgi:hypothetical protein